MSTVDLMDDADARVVRADAIENGTGVVAGAVVDDDEFGAGDAIEHELAHLGGGGLDGAFLVVRGHHDAQGRSGGHVLARTT